MSIDTGGVCATDERAGTRARDQLRSEACTEQRIEHAGVREEREEAARHRERKWFLLEPIAEALSHGTRGSRQSCRRDTRALLRSACRVRRRRDGCTP